MKIGVIIADIDEYLPIKEKLRDYNAKEKSYFNRQGFTAELSGGLITVLHCGIGKVNAAAAAMYLIGDGCDILLNIGLSGGISRVRRGEVVLADRFLEHDFDLTSIGFKPCEKPGQKYIYEADSRLVDIIVGALGNITRGTAVCGDRFICNDADRKFLKETFNATSCDMETAAIASVADMAGVAFAALRRISDDAGDDAETSYREMNTDEGDVLADIFLKALQAVVEA